MKIEPNLPSSVRTRGPRPSEAVQPDQVRLEGAQPAPEVDRAAALAACANQPRVVRDPRFQANFDHKQGWLGADGAYSLPLQDGRVLWLFSDTITGTIGEDGSLQPGFGMIHNSWGYQSSAQSPLKPMPESLFPGKDENSWYWVYAGQTIEKDQALVMLGSFTTAPGPDGFNFRQNGAAVARLRLGERPEVESITPCPHFRPGPPPTHWGAGLVPHQGNLYVYGTRDYGTHKELVLARTPRLDDFSAWTFWNGQEWSPDADLASPLGPSVANELSVTRQGDQFEVVAQVGNDIWRHRGPTPSGPFQAQLMMRIPIQDPGILTYNAKVHPHLQGEQGMLLTYNQNVLPLERLIQDPGLYRPQCFRYQGTSSTPA